jgi:hypothetical protein
VHLKDTLLKIFSKQEIREDPLKNRVEKRKRKRKRKNRTEYKYGGRIGLKTPGLAGQNRTFNASVIGFYNCRSARSWVIPQSPKPRD